MSFETWKAEFYPVCATEVEPGLPSIEHSLQKWTGALPDNLEKHGCQYKFYGVYEIDSDKSKFIRFNSRTCALCMNHICKSNLEPLNSYKGNPAFEACSELEFQECPLAQVLGMPCDLGEVTIYSDAQENPVPMIEALKKAKVWFLKQESK